MINVILLVGGDKDGTRSEASPAGEKRPPHVYTLATFGYTAEAIAADFADYRARFPAAREASRSTAAALPSPDG